MTRFAFLIITAAAVVGCHNGSNNARDTTGMTNTSAAGSVAGGAAGAATATPATPAPGDTTHRDTVRKTP